ncbi:MAG TPA: serine protease [Methanomassiliicoccales archaeon]|jgi:hypothetical protein
MFRRACSTNRESIYGVHGFSIIGDNLQANTIGSGFTIAPGIIVTAGHLVHLDSDAKKSIQTSFDVIRSPDIGQGTEKAEFIAEDSEYDIALLKIVNPRSAKFLTLEPNKIQTGTNCGSLGFPLCSFDNNGFHLVERFQGSYVSCYSQGISPKGKPVYQYEVDSLMYKGSSGCPGFLMSGVVIGMQSSYQMNREGQDGKMSQLAISNWVPSMEIIRCAKANGIKIGKR